MFLAVLLLNASERAVVPNEVIFSIVLESLSFMVFMAFPIIFGKFLMYLLYVCIGFKIPEVASNKLVATSTPLLSFPFCKLFAVSVKPA